MGHRTATDARFQKPREWADSRDMRPSSSPPRIRPGFVILLGVVVAPWSLLFGYAMLFEDGLRIGVYGRLVSAFAIFGMPVLVSILLRREAPTTRLAAAFLVSGGMLIFVV